MDNTAEYLMSLCLLGVEAIKHFDLLFAVPSEKDNDNNLRTVNKYMQKRMRSSNPMSFFDEIERHTIIEGEAEELRYSFKSPIYIRESLRHSCVSGSFSLYLDPLFLKGRNNIPRSDLIQISTKNVYT